MNRNSISRKMYTAENYPARLRPNQVGEILGFEAHEVPILVAKKLLKPLGKPVPNAQKFFAASVVMQLAQDENWLEKATQALYAYWKLRNGKKTVVGTVSDSDPTAKANEFATAV